MLFRHCQLLRVLCLVLLPSAPLSAQALVPSLPSAPAQPLTASAEIQAAQQALQAARTAKTLTALNHALTRASAAQLGFASKFTLDLSILPLALVFSKGSAATAANKAFLSKFIHDLAVLKRRYHMSDKQEAAIVKSDTIPPSLQSKGHQFFQDVIVLEVRLLRQLHTKDADSAANELSLAMPSRYTYQVLSPTRVQITPLAKGKPVLEAQWEDGQWRLDLGKALHTTMGAGTKSFGVEGVAETETSLKVTVNEPAPVKPITPQAAAFIEAVRKGDISAVKKMLHTNPTLANAPQASLSTGEIINCPLEEAMENNKVAMARLLLSAGAGVNKTDIHGETPLYKAAQGGNLSMVRLLLQYGAKVNVQNGGEDSFGWSPLQGASYTFSDNTGVIRLLIAHGAKVNGRDRTGRTALYSASQMGNLKNLRMLFSYRANVNVRDNFGVTPLSWAAEAGELNSVAFLLTHGARINARTQDKNTPLDFALKEHHKAVAALLRRHGGRR